jgi:hypothetical protein
MHFCMHCLAGAQRLAHYKRHPTHIEPSLYQPKPPVRSPTTRAFHVRGLSCSLIPFNLSLAGLWACREKPAHQKNNVRRTRRDGHDCKHKCENTRLNMHEQTPCSPRPAQKWSAFGLSLGEGIGDLRCSNRFYKPNVFWHTTSGRGRNWSRKG